MQQTIQADARIPFDMEKWCGCFPKLHCTTQSPVHSLYFHEMKRSPLGQLGLVVSAGAGEQRLGHSVGIEPVDEADLRTAPLRLEPLRWALRRSAFASFAFTEKQESGADQQTSPRGEVGVEAREQSEGQTSPTAACYRH
jgi:hypothetical protein